MTLLCILGVLCGFLDNYFLLSVHASLKKKNLINVWGGGGLGALGEIIFTWARRMGRN